MSGYQLQMRPPYPAMRLYGAQATPQTYGPPDMRPSGWNPFNTAYASTFGRNLAGLDMEEKSFDSVNAEGIETYPNELNSLMAADDVVGNGVFDPNDTHGNIHPDAGVFNDHQSLPGYIARDHFYQLSEVRDLTRKDGRVVYVPGGAVSLQQGQQETLTENELFWKLPPGMNPHTPEGVPYQSTVSAPTATYPVGQAETIEPTVFEKYKPFIIAGGVGLAIGAVWLACAPKKGRRR